MTSSPLGRVVEIAENGRRLADGGMRAYVLVDGGMRANCNGLPERREMTVRGRV